MSGKQPRPRRRDQIEWANSYPADNDGPARTTPAPSREAAERRAAAYRSRTACDAPVVRRLVVTYLYPWQPPDDHPPIHHEDNH